MKKILLSMLLVCLLAAFSIAEAERVPGTRVNIIPPPSYRLADQFSGFVDQKTRSSIMINEMPLTFADMLKSITNENLAGKGIKVISRESIVVNGNDAVLLKVSQNFSGEKYLKWLLLFGNNENTVMLTAAFPSGMDTRVSDVLKDSILSVKMDNNSKYDVFEGMPFKISAVGDFKIAKKVGTTLVMSPNGQFPLKSPDIPIIVVGASLSENFHIPDKSSFARNRLNKTALIEKVKILKEENIKIGNLTGVKIIAQARDKETKNSKFVFQTILYNKNGYYVMQAQSLFKEKNKYENIFNTTLNSFEEK